MIRQPMYLPYLGFFKKIETSDIFVILDDVQYSIRDGDNRNRIKTPTGTSFLTVPLTKPFGKKINEVDIATSQNWQEKQIQQIQSNYKSAPYFEDYWQEIKSILSKPWIKLFDVQLEFIEYFKTILDLKAKVVNSSTLNVTSTKSQRLVDICKKLKVDVYVSGEMGKNYVDESLFSQSNIQIKYEKFQHPIYAQLHGEFIPNLSILDVLFNEGENTKKFFLIQKIYFSNYFYDLPT